MPRKEQIIALRDILTASPFPAWPAIVEHIAMIPPDLRMTFHRAILGDMNAALAFVAATLPDWSWTRLEDDTMAVKAPNARLQHEGKAFTPACSLVVAVMSAWMDRPAARALAA